MNRLPAIPQVPVSIDDKLPTDAQVEDALKACGLVELSHEKKVTLGRYFTGPGAITQMKGSVMVTQQRLDGAMRMIYDEMQVSREEKTGKNRRAALNTLSHALGYLASRQADSFKLMMTLSGGKPIAEIGADFIPTTRAFTPGSEVKPNQTLITGSTVYLNSTEAPATTK